MNQTQPIFDRIAISISTICALHCAALPIIVSLFPALISSSMDDHYFHLLLLWVVVPSSAIALFMGCKKHRDKYVFILGTVGVGCLIGIAIYGHDLIGETGEKIGTVFASLIIVFVHFRNHQLCRKCHCEH